MIFSHETPSYDLNVTKMSTIPCTLTPYYVKKLRDVLQEREGTSWNYFKVSISKKFLGLFWTILIYLGESRSISVYIGLSWSISFYLGLSRTILDYLVLSGSISVYFGPTRSILVYFSLHQSILVYLGLSQTVSD